MADHSDTTKAAHPNWISPVSFGGRFALPGDVVYTQGDYQEIEPLMLATGRRVSVEEFEADTAHIQPLLNESVTNA